LGFPPLLWRGRGRLPSPPLEGSGEASFPSFGGVRGGLKVDIQGGRSVLPHSRSVARHSRSVARRPRGIARRPRGIARHSRGIARRPRRIARRPRRIARRPRRIARHSRRIARHSRRKARQPQKPPNPRRGSRCVAAMRQRAVWLILFFIVLNTNLTIKRIVECKQCSRQPTKNLKPKT
jgi:hypothetical protein